MDKHEHKHEHHKQDVEKKPLDKKAIITIIVIVGIIAVIIGAIVFVPKIFFKNDDTIITYNNYVFQKFEGNKWMTQQMVRGELYEIPFYNNPTQVLDIPIDPASINKLRNLSFNPNNTVYVSIAPNESSKIVIAAVEYVRILGNVYNIYNMNVKSAFNTDPGQETLYPVITCMNQSKNTIVIMQTLSDKNLVSIKGNCITIEAMNVNESVRVADAFAFKLLNIIPLDK